MNEHGGFGLVAKRREKMKGTPMHGSRKRDGVGTTHTCNIAAYEIKGDFPALLNVVGDPWEQICFAQGTVMVCHFLAELAQIPGLVVTRRAVA